LGDGVGIRHGVGIRPGILHRVVARCVPRLIWKKPKPEGRRRRPLGTASPGGHQAQPGLRAGGSLEEPGPRQNQPSPSRSVSTSSGLQIWKKQLDLGDTASPQSAEDAPATLPGSKPPGSDSRRDVWMRASPRLVEVLGFPP
ncbi:hypothetical protein H8959_004417, partial [Pygathrix nigripes]